MKKYLIYIFLLSFAFGVAQNEAAIWYFGENAGLDFNGGAPVALTDGALVTQEGCATISDLNGRLLFYTDGITVWNRNHVPMPNGTGLNGDASSTQSAIIVPAPENPNLYFIFTVHDAGEPEGLQYSMVDIALGGGLGDVTTKNVPLASPVTEKLTAVEHANGTDIWVLAHAYGNDQFLAYRVTPTGLVTTPVVSAVGLDFPILINGNGSRGYIKVSPNGQFLAAVSTESVEVFRFDPASGRVGNPILLNDYFTPNIVNPNRFYGTEFSPDSSKLYIGQVMIYRFRTFESTIHQFDLANFTEAALVASGIQISGVQTTELGALQLGIDGKIYAAFFDQPFMGVINNPNAQGLASDFAEDAVSLGGRTNRLGLPPFIQSFFVVGINARNFCLGDDTAFTITSSDPITNISWDFGDGNTSDLENPMHRYAAPGRYTVSVTVDTATNTETESREVTIFPTPVANTAQDMEVCSVSETLSFDLTEIDTEILGTQSPTDFVVSYHASQDDATFGTKALTNPYTNTDLTETLFARISNVENTGCFDTSSFGINLHLIPLPDPVSDVTVCDDDGDGFFVFDLNLIRNSLQANEDPIFSEVSFHRSQTDADNNANPLPDNYTNTQAMETLFYRIQNGIQPTCFDTGQVRLEVVRQILANTPRNLEVCDDDNDGRFIFDLRTVEPEVVGTQNRASLELSYHGSQADAEADANRINPQNYENGNRTETIFVRVANSANTSCFDTTSFRLEVFDTPVAPSAADWAVCDADNDGQFGFDLSDRNPEILNGNTAQVVSYHVSMADAQMGMNSITGIFENTSNPQQIYFRLENQVNSDCFATGSFEITVSNIPLANLPSSLVVCDDAQTGVAIFNLSQQDNGVLGGQDANLYSVSYHPTLLDAMNGDNTLPRTSYQNTNGIETIYTRITNNAMEDCFATTSFEVMVNPLPRLDLEDRYVICPDNPDLEIDGGSFESYEWRNDDNMVISNEQFLAVTGLGFYSLTVTETTNGITCSNTATFEVVSSGAPDSIEVDMEGFSDNVLLTVQTTGIGTFEYSLDGENYQESNVFEVFPGEYTVFVRDPFACRVLSTTIFALGYQKFFTPNGDDRNEYWNIIGGENMPNASVFIFDRYGKLLRQLATTERGWDGTYLGNDMPSSNYWFRFVAEEGQQMTGHFALKR